MADTKGTPGFAEVLRSAAPLLKGDGFRKNGRRFVRENDEAWGWVTFQKSVGSTADETLYTVNLRVALKGILNVYEEPQPLAIELSHWLTRLGLLVSGRDDWYVAGEAAVDDDVIEQLRSVGIPAVIEHMSNERLIALWSTGRAVGTTEFRRLECLAAALAATGRRQEAEEAVATMLATSKGAPTEVRANVNARLVRRALAR
jgi:hypothetical protein